MHSGFVVLGGHVPGRDGRVAFHWQSRLLAAQRAPQRRPALLRVRLLPAVFCAAGSDGHGDVAHGEGQPELAQRVTIPCMRSGLRL